MRQRRIIAGGGVALLLVLVVLGTKGCLDSQRQDDFRTFVRDVGSLVQLSDSESKNLFAVLSKPGTQGQVQLQNAVNGYASDAQQLVDRAKGTDRPDELADAKRYFVESLELRRDGLSTIARELRSALSGSGKQAALGRIASQMQLFLASDVVYSQRVLPNLSRPLKKEGLLDQVEVPKSHFLPDLQWVRPSVVSARLAGAGGSAGPVAPGLHGMSLIGVTAKPGGQALAQGGATSITITSRLSFDVTVQDAGSNNERDVVVQLSITGAGKPVVREQTLPTIGAGEQKLVTIPLAAAPPTGRPVSIKVQVKPVPGEKKVDNNSATYPAIFTR
jgi:hypothetical protein